MLKGKKIVIGVTGSIAAYKIPFLVRLLIREEAEVIVMMTPASRDFVTPLTLSTLSRHPVIIEPFTKADGSWNSHVELGTWADVLLLAPVTANTLGKMAHGIADNFLVTAYLSAKCPVFFAPAMDLDMYLHPTTQQNIALLRSFGNNLIEPQTGELASGLSGPGRMAEPENILATLRDFFKKKEEFKGKKILVTAGPTQEPIDPVRFIGNRSSGLMGVALAEEAAGRGGAVTLLLGPSSLEPVLPGIRVIRIGTAEELRQECLLAAPAADIIVMAAAVSDYRVPHPGAKKIKKSGTDLTLKLEPAPDILKELAAKKKKRQLIVGFSLETDHEMENARKKLKEKNLDMVVLNTLNDPGAGFESLTNKVTLLLKNGRVVRGKLKSKKEVAADIFNALQTL
ncbi:MAG TPA: bifunctional phosphopantothenoylcysteine decarboxylase/phosphopantothenate--cysteine ligase CoaBC [Bacteroidales bacterium]|nr:bifunctional phosphopantothenoylcysteine decarboxylase/phosphopantothenate--cysteine ligase CoaBC [Bacteroidales bacterium]